MIRLQVPWSAVFLLLAIWTYGLYDIHLGESSEYVSPDVQETALLYLDRNLTLADELAAQPAWVRTVLWFGSRQDELEDARDNLLLLHDEDLLDETGESALAVILSELGETPPENLKPVPFVTAVLDRDLPAREDMQLLAERLVSGEAAWWEAALARRWLAESPSLRLTESIKGHERKGVTLLRRAVISSAAVWGVVAMGLCLLPVAIRRMRAGTVRWEREKARDYPWAWAASLVLAVFLIADLAAGYFMTGAYVFIATDEPGFLFDATVDLLWRAFAPVVAILILFRKPRHAVRVLRVNGPPVWSVVFGVFALLALVDIALYLVIGDLAGPDPTGGLDPMEAGWRGLIYGLISGCIAAPIVEEITYRGLLLRGLERPLGFKAAAIVVSIIFALGHNYDLYGLIGVGIFGFAAALVYRSTGSLMAAILLHALYNLSITLPSWWFYRAPY